VVSAVKWRDIPLALRIALVLKLAILVVNVALRWVEPGLIASELVQSVAAAMGFAVQVLFAVGTFELAQRLVRGARRGAQIAWFAALLDLALVAASTVGLNQRFGLDVEHWWRLSLYLHLPVDVGLVAGLTLAGWSRRRGIAVLGLLVGLTAVWLPLVMERTSEDMLSFFRSWEHLQTVDSGLHLAALLLLALASSVEDAAAPPPLATRGIRLAMRTLWLRALAVGLGAAIALIATVSESDDALQFAGYAMVAVAILSVASLTGFAVGMACVARAAVTGMRALPLYASAVTALMSAQVAIGLVPVCLWMPWWGGIVLRNSFGPYDSDRASTTVSVAQVLATMWATVAPLLALASLYCFSLAIAGFAARRSLPDLRLRARRSLWASVFLVLPIAIMQWRLATGANDQPSILPLLASLASGVIGAIAMARLSTAASGALPEEPTLPAATAR
jgi:hypothetical protein